MRVVRLELQGFKSFKDKTVIHFDHSITGVVGPNGCGKSNIVDAFFWVMGEQSYKHMRGSGSDDLIFNGSSRYTASALAEATLVMEVPDVTAQPPAGATASSEPPTVKMREISVTRRLHRGGEGEYFINGIPSRLRDIQEYFMDTGVGAKGYSIIEQGQIGKIVNAKPEDRRVLIEEAAGIAKYKARKKETQRKLEAAQGNLGRLHDVVQEIERSLESLDRQAQKARKYREYKQELLHLEMTWGRRKHKALSEKLDSLRKQKVLVEADLECLRSELQRAEIDLETLRLAQLDSSKRTETLQQEIQQATLELTQDESSLELSRRRQSDLASQLENILKEKAELATTIASDQKALAQKKESLEIFQKDESFIQERVTSLDREVQAVRDALKAAQSRVELARRDLYALIEKNSTQISEKAALQAKRAAKESEFERTEARRPELEARLAQVKEEVAKIEAHLQEISDRQTWLRTAIDDQKAELSKHEQTSLAAKVGRETEFLAFTEAQARLESLRELDQAHEGVASGAKALLDSLQASAYLLLDLLEIDPDAESAVQGWLESRAETVFLSRSTNLAQALGTLETSETSRVALLHAGQRAGGKLENSRVPTQELRLKLESAGLQWVGVLTDFVKVHAPGEIGALAMQSLSGVILVGELTAETISTLDPNLGGWALVDLSGRVVEADGLVRAGCLKFDNATQVLQRKRAIRDLEAELAMAEKKFNSADEAQRTAEKSLELAKTTLQKLQEQLRDFEIQKASQERELRSAQRLELEAAQSVAGLGREQEELKRQAHEFSQALQTVGSDLQEFEVSKAAKELAVSEATQKLAEVEARAHGEEERLHGEKVQAASQSERARSMAREVASFEELLRSRESRQARLEELESRLQTESTQFSGGDSGIQARIEAKNRLIGERATVLAEHKNQSEELHTRLTELLDRSKESRQRVDEKNSISGELAIQIEKSQGELLHLVQNLEEKYGMGCLEAAPLIPEQQDMPAPVMTEEMSAEAELKLNDDVERLRERIRRLGEVNPMAVEEYDQLKQRHDAIVQEKTDLERSIQDLFEAIELINKTSEDRFAKAFEAIATRFERLFPIVFGGGQAKLSLVYPEGSTDILEAGVDILAQPPGKKIVNIGLLSGGEKALTAVALIFGIFLVKPSPFCILDEVDAPLDDANIGKFNALLKEMSSKTQFILITHNKKTMELNDTLYGVTMEDPGVSKMVSIQLS